MKFINMTGGAMICGIFSVAGFQLALEAQTPTIQVNRDSITANITIQNTLMQSGQNAQLILSITNTSDASIDVHTNLFRVHVDKKEAEADSTHAQRSITHRLLPGEAPTMESGYDVTSIPAHLTKVGKWNLNYNYNLVVPGEYTAYMEVVDPVSHRRFRTNTVKFTITEAPK